LGTSQFADWDPLTAEVAGRILADEERHVRFHSQQLRLEFAALPPWARLPTSWAWQLLVTGSFASSTTSIRRGETSPPPQQAGEPAQAGHPAPPERRVTAA
jgi:hypothetical protein